MLKAMFGVDDEPKKSTTKRRVTFFDSNVTAVVAAKRYVALPNAVQHRSKRWTKLAIKWSLPSIV